MDRFRVFTNMIWRFLERVGAQAVAFIVSIILARLLSPEDYGVLALAVLLPALLRSVSDCGIGSALIQKEDVGSLDYSSAFFFHLAVSVILYAALFLAAPAVSVFYGRDDLCPLIRILSLTLLTSAVHAVPEAYVIRNLKLKLFFYSTLVSTALSAAVGISLAYKGFGVRALVAQQLTVSVCDSLILFLASGWRPEKRLSFGRLMNLLRFGWKIMAASLAGTLYDNIRQFLFGRYYTAEGLGLFNRGKQLPDIVVINVNAPLQTALYPVLSASQHDTGRVRSMLQRSIETAAYVTAPLMIGLAIIAPGLVRVLLTDRWSPCVPYIRIFCLVYFFFPVEECNNNAVKALGRSGLFLKAELVKKGIGILLLILTVRIGSWALCLSLIPYTIAVQLINGSLNGRLVDYGFTKQLHSELSGILPALIMGACILPVGFAGLSDLLTILLQVLLGAAIFIAVSAVTRSSSFLYLKEILLSIIEKKLH